MDPLQKSDGNDVDGTADANGEDADKINGDDAINIVPRTSPSLWSVNAGCVLLKYFPQKVLQTCGLSGSWYVEVVRDVKYILFFLIEENM